MDEMNQYNALLEIYKKQETSITEKQQEFKEIMAKYQNTMENLSSTRTQLENDMSKLSQKRLNFTKNLHQTLNTCEETDLSWKQIKHKQTDIVESQKKVANISDNHLDIVKGVAEDLSKLDSELQSENVLSKIADYKSKTQMSQELLETRVQEFKLISALDPKLPQYQLVGMQEDYKKKCFPKKIDEINADVARTKNNLETIHKKIRELESSM